MNIDIRLLRASVCQIAVLLIAGAVADGVFAGGSPVTVSSGILIGVALMFVAVLEL